MASLAERTRDWLTPEGVELFAKYKRLFKRVNPILTMHQVRVFFDIPKSQGVKVHSVHDKEGKTVRQFLRRQPECVDWTDSEFSTGWINVIENVLKSVD